MQLPMAPNEMFVYAGENAVSAITEAPDTIVCQILDGGESVLCGEQIFSLPEAALGIGDWEFWVYLGVYVFLVLFAGLCSGLTLGLLSLDVMQLTVLMEAGTPDERVNAKKISPVVKRHHLLLVTLLLANACAVEAMPIFLDRITDPVTAILISVTAVLLFGEVFPQALCSRYGLKIGATLVPIVWTLICIFFVISWPLSKLLDCLLGKEENKYLGRGELKALVGLHGPSSDQLKKLGDAESPLTLDEVLIIKGALEMRDKSVGDAMISIEDVFMLDKNAKLDRKTMRLLLKESHSRVPVYDGDRTNIVGVLLVKMLITLDPDLAIPISKLVQDSVCFRTVDYVAESMPLFDLLNQFQTGRSHLSIVRKSIDAHSTDSLFNESYKEEVIGIITLEDVIEELLQEEILDEKDTYTETEKKIMIARDNLQSYSRAHSLIGNIKLKRYNPISRSKSQPAFEISNSCKVNRKKSRTKPKKYEPKETISDFDSDPDDPKIPLLKTTY